MRTFAKSTKLDNVCYDIRGPVMDEADRMIARGEKILSSISAILHHLTSTPPKAYSGQ